MMDAMRQRATALLLSLAPIGGACADAPAEAPREFSVAVFECDITIPIGHACMGGGIADARTIADPLFAKGFVFRGLDLPVVVVALDWCQCNNDSYDRWRTALAEAAGTVRQRVMLATVHQHDAPICDLTAQKLLDDLPAEHRKLVEEELRLPYLKLVTDYSSGDSSRLSSRIDALVEVVRARAPQGPGNGAPTKAV